jgi:hypothetical protein
MLQNIRQITSHSRFYDLTILGETATDGWTNLKGIREFNIYQNQKSYYIRVRIPILM